MAPAVACATTLFLAAACWHQVSGESLFLSRRSSSTVPSGISAALSEEGYQQVASLKSDEDMNDFILRVLQKDGLEGNTSYLQGLVPWYSGTRAVQSLASLQKELSEKPWVRRTSQASLTSKNSAVDGPHVSGDVSTNVYKKVPAVANSPSAQSTFTKNASSELQKEKGPSPQTCLAQCYTGHRAKAAWKEDKCHHQHCYRCPECVAEQPGKELSAPEGREFRLEDFHVKAEAHQMGSSSRACLAQCYSGKRAQASWKEQKCHHQHCAACPECDVKQSAQEFTPPKGSGLHDEESRVSAVAKSPSALSKFAKNASSELHAEKANMQVEDKREGASSRACSAQCYIGHRAKASWKNDKCHHQRCYGCPECDAKQPAQKFSPSKGSAFRDKESDVEAEDEEKGTFSRVCLAQCYTGKREHASWKEQKCHHQHCSGCPECDANHPAQELNPSKGSELHDEKSHIRADDKEQGAPPTALETQRQTMNTLRNGSSVSKNSSGFIKAPSTHGKSIGNTINHLDPRVAAVAAAASVASANPSAAAPPAFKAIAPSKKQVKPHAEQTYMSVEDKKQLALELGPFRGNELYDEEFHVKAKGKDKGTPPAAREAQRHTVQETQPSFDARVATAVVPDNKSTPREPDETMQGAAQPSDRMVLPEVPSLLDKSKHVLDALNKHVNTLKQQLTEAESESQKTVASKRYDYERMLEQQIENSTAMANANEELGREIQNLREQNVALRNRAMHLKAKGAQLHKYMLDLKANITLAQEYVEGALENRSNDSAALFVLRQLDEQDAALAKSKAHASALQQVTVSLLQTSRTASPDVLAVVRNLRERFDDLDREKAASMAALKQQFEEQFSRELQHQDVLKEEYLQLENDLDKQSALHEKLQAAVNHLENSVSSLDQQIQGLQAYAVRVSSMH